MLDSNFIKNITYLFILLLIGLCILIIRRKAKGTKSLYKIVLIFLSIVITKYIFPSETIFEEDFIENISTFLLIILLFELGMRMNPENIELKYENIRLFSKLILINSTILTLVITFLLNVETVHALIISLLLSIVEYFMIDQLKKEGDLANPLIMLFIFSIIYFYKLQNTVFLNALLLIQNIIIGLGTGIIIGIIILKILKHKIIRPIHEIGLLISAIITYVIAIKLEGSGILAVLVLGAFFGNSYVRKKGNMNSFSSFIFKPLEVMIYMLIGLIINFQFSLQTTYYSVIILTTYFLLRFIIIHSEFSCYSLHNKILLTLAPKGMVYTLAIIIIATSNMFMDSIINIMFTILVLSLIIGIFVEYAEEQKINKIEKIYRLWNINKKRIIKNYFKIKNKSYK